MKTTLKTITTPIGRGHTSFSRDLSIESNRKEKKKHKKKHTYITNIKEREQTFIHSKDPSSLVFNIHIYISGYRIRKKNTER